MLRELQNQTVTMVSFDSSLYLLFGNAGQIQIETPLTLTDPDGVRIWSEGEPGAVTGALVHLMWAILEGVDVDEVTGALRIRFTDGRRIDVRPDDRYEAWNFAGARGHKIVCVPGGGLTVWSPTDAPVS